MHKAIVIKLKVIRGQFESPPLYIKYDISSIPFNNIYSLHKYNLQHLQFTQI